MNTPLKSTFLAVAAALLVAVASASADPDQAAQDAFKTIMGATVANDLAGFDSVCDDTMKAAITAPKLASVSQQFAPPRQGRL